MPRDTDGGKIACPHDRTLAGECVGFLPQRRHRTARQTHALSTVTIALPLLGRVFRGRGGNLKEIVRIFVDPGEPGEIRTFWPSVYLEIKGGAGGRNRTDTPLGTGF